MEGLGGEEEVEVQIDPNLLANLNAQEVEGDLGQQPFGLNLPVGDIVGRGPVCHIVI